jgi:steroid delta-isomerase-like uncharacterized protein
MEGTMATSTDNKAIARRVMDELWTQGKLESIDQLYADNCVFHDLSMSDDIRGRDGMRQYARMYRTACPDLSCTPEDFVIEGDKVAVRWEAHGTHRGDFMGVAPTGKQVHFRGIQIQRIVNGKVAEEWSGFNTLGALQEIGAVPQVGHMASSGH